MSEVITRSNPWKGEVSPSSLDTASCMRKFLYDKVLGLSPDIPKVALSYGTCIHKGVETYYIHKGTVGHAEAVNLAIKAFALAWKEAECEGDKKRNFNVGVVVLNEYFKAYERDNAEFIPTLVECDQWMPLPNGAMVLMKIDRVRKDGNYNTVVDTKTTSMALTDFYFRNFENALATTLYFWAVAEILGQCDAVQIDSIRTPVNMKAPSEGFVRRTFMRTEVQVHDAITTAVHRTNHIMGVLKESRTVQELLDLMPCNQHNCNDYGGCPYLGVCKHGLGHPSLCTEFVPTNVHGTFIRAVLLKGNVEAALKYTVCEV